MPDPNYIDEIKFEDQTFKIRDSEARELIRELIRDIQILGGLPSGNNDKDFLLWNNDDQQWYPNQVITGVDYSITEQDTGLKWIDGNKIYQKTLTGTTVSTGDHTAIDDFTNKNFIYGFGYCHQINSLARLMVPSYLNTNYCCGLYYDPATNFLMLYHSPSLLNSQFAITVLYTKTSNQGGQ